MDNDKVTTIIAADFMYLIFLGKCDIMERIVNKLNNDVEISLSAIKNIKSYRSTKTQQRFIYIKHDICTPCIDVLESENVQKILYDDAVINIKKYKKKNQESEIITAHDIDIHKKYVIPDEGVETAQCLTYADISCNDTIISRQKIHNKDLMMLMVMIESDTHYKLSFPVLQLDEEENPDKLISKWLKDHNIDNLVKELTIRPINIVGNEHDILVFTAFVIE